LSYSIYRNNVEIHAVGPVKNIYIGDIQFPSQGGDCIERFSIVFRTGDLTTSGLTIEIPSDYTIQWAVYSPVFESNKIYHLVFTKFANTKTLLGNWVVYDK
jgi:hypothetical protein